MSRYYHMSVAITGSASDRVDAIKQAAATEWPFDDWCEHDSVLTSSCDAQLCGGETEEQFVERLAKAVWTANGGPCQVDVNATYLEDLPYEGYSFDDHDYDRLMTGRGLPD